MWITPTILPPFKEATHGQFSCRFFAEFFLGLVADILVSLCAWLRRKKEDVRGRAVSGCGPDASRRTNNTAGLK
jgi:hypothetical protein